MEVKVVKIKNGANISLETVKYMYYSVYRALIWTMKNKEF